jgi:hypothetical protein
MRILCTTASLPPDMTHLLPPTANGVWRWPVDVGREYAVLALSKSPLGLWYVTYEHHEAEYPVDAPLALFDVTDPTVPSEWRLTIDRGEPVAAGPIEFEDQFFADDVQERRDDAFARYRGMKARLGIGRPHVVKVPASS